MTWSHNDSENISLNVLPEDGANITPKRVGPRKF
jgi:hypothetical protein